MLILQLSSNINKELQHDRRKENFLYEDGNYGTAFSPVGLLVNSSSTFHILGGWLDEWLGARTTNLVVPGSIFFLSLFFFFFKYSRKEKKAIVHIIRGNLYFSLKDDKNCTSTVINLKHTKYTTLNKNA